MLLYLQKHLCARTVGERSDIMSHGEFLRWRAPARYFVYVECKYNALGFLSFRTKKTSGKKEETTSVYKAGMGTSLRIGL